MRNLIIVCNDSFGLDVKKLVIEINKNRKENYSGELYRIKGFLGTDGISDDLKILCSPYLGSVSEYYPEEEDCFAISIVSPKKKREIVDLLKSRKAHFETLRAPWVMAHLDFVFPEGCIIGAQSIMDSAIIGAFTTLYHSMIGFDATVEEYSSIMAYANITTSHIGKNVLIGENSVIMRAQIGDGAVILPNSVVVKNVKPETIVGGNPARRLREGKIIK